MVRNTGRNVHAIPDFLCSSRGSGPPTASSTTSSTGPTPAAEVIGVTCSKFDQDRILSIPEKILGNPLGDPDRPIRPENVVAAVTHALSRAADRRAENTCLVI